MNRPVLQDEFKPFKKEVIDRITVLEKAVKKLASVIMLNKPARKKKAS